MYISHPGTAASNAEIEELTSFVEDTYGYVPDVFIGNLDYIEVFTDKNKLLIAADVGNLNLIKTAVSIHEDPLF